MQPEVHVLGIKVADFPDKKLTIRGIFQHNHNWDRYQATHKDTLRGVEVEEVHKMLSCHGKERGCKLYACPKCGEAHVVTFGCNSRLCSGCGKPHADKWAADLRKTILSVPHRHLAFTIAEELRPLVRTHRELLMKVMMDAVIKTLDEVLGPSIRGRGPKRSGAIAVLHPFGRDLEFKPHVHVICPEGAFVGESFVPRTYFPMDAFRKTWQYHVLTGFRRALKERGENPEAEALIDKVFREHPDGFYVRVTKETRIQDPDKVIRYVGRYVRHPAIAESRLVGYDGQRVTFQWRDHKTGARKQRTLSVGAFIEALLQHVPERHFKMVRHYGVYSRSLVARFRRVAGLWSMKQAKLERFEGAKRRGREVRCPRCGAIMDFVLYDRPPPVGEASFGSRITDWPHLSASPAKAVGSS